jgi:hypothetical protein
VDPIEAWNGLERGTQVRDVGRVRVDSDERISGFCTVDRDAGRRITGQYKPSA